MEVDALAEAASGERWAVELKWQNKVVGEKELVALVAKAQALHAQPWCVSRSGFTPAARAYARERNILISTRTDLERLEKTFKAAR
jgi:predicted RecB family endonuclease